MPVRSARLVVLIIGLGESVPAFGVGHHVQRLGVDGRQHGLEAPHARAADRPGRQPLMKIRVVRRIDPEVLARQTLLPMPEGVLTGGGPAAASAEAVEIQPR